MADRSPTSRTGRAPSSGRSGRHRPEGSPAARTSKRPDPDTATDEGASPVDDDAEVVGGPRWGGGDVALGILAALLLTNVTLLIAISLAGVANVVPGVGFDAGWMVGQHLTGAELEPLPTWANMAIEWRLLGNVGLWVGLAGVAVWAVRTKGSTLREDLGLAVVARDVPLGLAVGALAFGAVQLVMWPVSALVGADAVSAPARSLGDAAAGPLGAVLLIAMVVVIAPFVEELFYRGLALRAFSRRLGPRWGLVASAVVFAALHLQDIQFPALVLVGLLFGYLAQRYGRLGPAIFAHTGYNAVNVVLLLWVL